jgi:hypothetical protein
VLTTCLLVTSLFLLVLNLTYLADGRLKERLLDATTLDACVTFVHVVLLIIVSVITFLRRGRAVKRQHQDTGSEGPHTRHQAALGLLYRMLVGLGAAGLALAIAYSWVGHPVRTESGEYQAVSNHGRVVIPITEEEAVRAAFSTSLILPALGVCVVGLTCLVHTRIGWHARGNHRPIEDPPGETS